MALIPSLLIIGNSEEVISDIKEITEWLLNLKHYFTAFWDEKLEKEKKELEESLKIVFS
jgi:hypothetical protein